MREKGRNRSKKSKRKPKSTGLLPSNREAASIDTAYEIVEIYESVER
jgi:hypothetical protein